MVSVIVKLPTSARPISSRPFSSVRPSLCCVVWPLDTLKPAPAPGLPSGSTLLMRRYAAYLSGFGVAEGWGVFRA